MEDESSVLPIGEQARETGPTGGRQPPHSAPVFALCVRVVYAGDAVGKIATSFSFSRQTFYRTVFLIISVTTGDDVSTRAVAFRENRYYRVYTRVRV